MITIDGIQVPTDFLEIVDCNVIRVEVGTTGARGGDTGHGGRTYFAIHNEASTDMRVRVDGGEWNGADRSLEIAFGGDSEMDTFIQALEYAVEALKFYRDKQ